MRTGEQRAAVRESGDAGDGRSHRDTADETSVHIIMSVNVSSSLVPLERCFNLRASVSISTALLITYYVLFLPLFVFVLYLGCQRWRKQRSVAAATTSHSDIFTFHMVALEMISVVGSFFYCYGAQTYQRSVMKVGTDIYSIIVPGQTLFHLLTCVERYLAVVHPVTYLGLRQAGGVRIRNISIGCVWLISLGWPGLSLLSYQFWTICGFILLLISSAVVSFCCLSVLCVLIRPGPGKVGGNGGVDQSKRRAFYTIVVILGALSLRFFSSLIFTLIDFLSMFSQTERCIWFSAAGSFILPSNLVLPLLFLHRAGKLPHCKRATESA